MNDRILSAHCDSCHRHCPCLVRVVEEKKTSVCGSCDPESFERQSRADIDAWLNGGNVGREG